MDRTRECIAREIETLEYCEYPRLGAMSSRVNDAVHEMDEDGEDSTIADVVAALRVMGELFRPRTTSKIDCHHVKGLMTRTMRLKLKTILLRVLPTAQEAIGRLMARKQ